MVSHPVLIESRLKHIEALPIWKSDGRNDVSVSAKIRYARKGEYLAASAGSAVQIVGPKVKDTANCKTLRVVGHKGNVNSVDFSHSTDNYLLTAGDDRYDQTLKFWCWVW